MSFNGTPRKPGSMPGQHSSTTPAASRFRSSLVPMTRPSPARNFQPASKLSAPSATARDLFMTTTPKSSRVTEFAPKLPSAATKAPPSVRKFAPRGTGAGMAGTASKELFEMRIPSPDPNLSGEALTKAVPDNLNRKGTVYADQYLADKCPPEFDDDQRRQFFCILDLRRLKFAANEIFAKKDWKLNIMNFAKEYEKSRGLIMLRYGLYEFKNVKPTAEVMKKWRKAHGLPDQEPEPERPAAITTTKSLLNAGSTKRKADEELEPQNNTLKASTANQNKRRNFEQEPTDDVPKFAPSPLKVKRKADDADEVDENQRSKLSKSAPSAARSKLEGIINSVQSGSSTPAAPKRPAVGTTPSTIKGGPLFSVTKPGEDQGSIFATKSNPYAPPSNGIINSSSQLQSSQFQPGGLLNGSAGSVLSGHKIGSNPAAKSNIFGYLSESSANNSGAENGNDDADAETESEPDHESEPETASQDAAVASSGTSTPLVSGATGLFNFGKPNSNPNPFASVFNKPSEKPVEKPAEDPTINSAKGGLFDRISLGADGQPLRSTPEETATRPSPTGEPAPETEQAKTPAKPPGDYTFNPATTPINFSQGGNSIFGAKAVPATDGNSIFGVKAAATPVTNGSSLFGAKPASTPITNGSSLFGAKPTSSQVTDGSSKVSTEPEKAQSSSAASIFGSAPLAAPSATSEQPSVVPQPLFGTNVSSQSGSVAQQPSQTLFGGVQKAPEAEKANPASTSGSLFGMQKPSPTTSFSFGATTAKPTFGETNKASEPDASTANDSKIGLFASQPSLGPSTSSNGAPTPVSTPLFGAITQNTEPPKAASQGIQSPFGSNTSSSTGIFGISAPPSTLPAADTSFASKRSFGVEDSQPAKRTMFGRPEPIDDSGNQRPSSPMGQADKKPMFSGVTDGSAPNSPIPGRKILTPKRLGGRFGQNAQRQASPVPAQDPKPTYGGTPSFGSSTQPDAPNGFGNSSSTPSFQFGSAIATEKRPEETAATTSNFFGNNAPTSSSTFSFGTQNNAPTESAQSVNATPFTFGGSGSQANSSGAGNTNFNFTGGSTTPGGGPFSFGHNQDSSSNQGSFTFGAGGPAQPSSAPFGGSATPTPSGSFNFQFGGGQGPSTPGPTEKSQPMFGAQTNGSSAAPAFNFMSATPPQTTPNVFAAKPAASNMFSGLLQPGGGTSTGASSPFPAPSSLNTTPANGTPEPQAQEDGEEPVQEQISLTEGGPGEEDEEILHEVRAKATKFVPVVKGSEDDVAGKSPWHTQGVGPLRVLKNKTTGNVRMLLRAEPRGHIALNKAILPRVEYKPNGKYLKFMASNHDGSGLETWMLQIKTPEGATELAGVLEANKAANN